MPVKMEAERDETRAAEMPNSSSTRGRMMAVKGRDGGLVVLFKTENVE
jgi:hypothetical protein